MARAYAARRPDRVLTLTVVGTPPPRREGRDARLPGLFKELQTDGSEKWARRTMRERLGSAFPQEACEWWAKFMGRTALSTQIGWMSTLAYADITADVPRISCPTLVITTEASPLASVAENRAWQELIPGSKLLALPGDAYHVAVTQADRCAEATLEFIRTSSVYDH